MKIKLTILIALSICIFLASTVFAVPVDTNAETVATIESYYTEPSIPEETEIYVVIKTEPSFEIEETLPIDDTYPIASQIWNALKMAGYNDYVCAGILGNIMAEVGGQTLDLSNWEYWSTGKHSGTYGICQWTQGRKAKLLKEYGSDIESQIKFLLDEIKSEINTYGKLYKKGFDYEQFCEMQDYKKAALAFAKCYERCGSGSYKVRQRNAEKAYSYFVK